MKPDQRDDRSYRDLEPLVDERNRFDARSALIMSRRIAEYGEIGSAIPGSKYFRDYCRMCGEPIRLGHWPIKCSSCIAAEHPGWNHSSTDGSHATNGSYENAIRIIEDGSLTRS